MNHGLPSKHLDTVMVLTLGSSHLGLMGFPYQSLSMHREFEGNFTCWAVIAGAALTVGVRKDPPTPEKQVTHGSLQSYSRMMDTLLSPKGALSI